MMVGEWKGREREKRKEHAMPKTGPKPTTPTLRALRGSRTRKNHVPPARALHGPPLTEAPDWISARAVGIWQRDIVR